jgi:hypothetical protein
VDVVTYGVQTPDVSEGRFPDGGTNIYPMAAPTPGGPNKFVNTAPVLAPIPNQTVAAGNLLTLAASASDVDAPPQFLEFSLAPGAAAGASVDPVSGVFAWPIPPSPVSTTNSVTLRVTDDGTPPLSASQTFTIVVTPGGSPPAMLPPQIVGGQIVLNWSSEPGFTYRLEYKDDLMSTNWTTIGGDVLAAGANCSKSDNFGGTNSARFYRVLLEP